MKAIAISLTLCLLSFSSMLKGAADGATLEVQLRRDVESFLRARAAQSVQADAIATTVEKLVSEMKAAFPALLREEATMPVPSDEALQRRYDEMARIGAGARQPVLVSFYLELWKAKRLGSQQRTIFERLMYAITATAEKQKNEKTKG